ncbi:unnamed protein product [Toxocara canis]|uniref:Solute carrier family 40 protein n=1 Tax=Toxocara canis TaxID=6265 RepID=A0A183V0B8_TOXCA|nr:unnamed protein product [Toxocara canis]
MSPLEPSKVDTRDVFSHFILDALSSQSDLVRVRRCVGDRLPSEISVAFVLGPICDHIFDWWWETTLVLMLRCYICLTCRKNAALDEMERRVNLFWLAMCIGSPTGHLLGNRVVSTMPATVLIQPLIFGLAACIQYLFH